MLAPKPPVVFGKLSDDRRRPPHPEVATTEQPVSPCTLQIRTTMSTQTEQAEYRGEALAVRSIIGGALMGLANLVPGISGGTMLLATGVYPQFIRGVAEVSTCRFRAKTVVMLCCVIGAAGLAVLGLAGPISELVIHHRWAMYSIFIGLTLGGVPILWRMLQSIDGTVVFTSILGIAFMAVIALLNPGAAGTESDGGAGGAYAMLFAAGLVAGSAMILPGLSGGYLLLVLGQYVALLSAIGAMVAAARHFDVSAAIAALPVIVPIGLGAAVGVVGVSNAVKWLLERYERQTLGVLLGLLLGAVIGLWPFVEGVEPEVGSSFRGGTVALEDGPDSRLVLEETGREIKPQDWPTQTFTPSPAQVGASIGLLLAGLLVSIGVGRLGTGKPERVKRRDAVG
jgi:putative membrane protein